MKTKIIKSDNEKELKLAGEYIAKGKLVCFPTETVYGIGANALDKRACMNIFKAKGRPQDNPLIVHIDDTSKLSLYVKDISSKSRLLISAFWPGPLTIIFKKRSIIPDNVTGGLDTVAIRIPENKTARDIIKYSNRPVAAPSANISGKPSPTRFSHVFDYLNGKVDMIVDGDNCNIGLESTVIDMTSDIPVILRPGKIGAKEISSLIGEVLISKHVNESLDEGEKVMSPGLKYTHYSPKGNLLLVEGNIEDVSKYISENILNDRLKGNKAGILYYDNRLIVNENLVDLLIHLGENEEDMGKNLFNALIEFDKNNIEIIYCQMPKGDGLMEAIKNRLIKASGHNIKRV